MKPFGKSLAGSTAARVIGCLCVCWIATCGAYRSDVAPLAFGMTPDEAANALGLPLVYHSGRAGSEIYLARGSAGVPGPYPVDKGLALQFRHGHLTGWKRDWQLRRPWPF